MFSYDGLRKLPIPIYIAMTDVFERIKGMTEISILSHTTAEVDIQHVYPKSPAGCTGFSNVRFDISYGIYLDPDMIVLDDIAKLWAYRKTGKYTCIEDGSTEVAVIDCAHQCRNKKQLNLLPMNSVIPKRWNVEDCDYLDSPLPDDIGIFHFTAMKYQPWFNEHPNHEATELYKRWAI